MKKLLTYIKKCFMKKIYNFFKNILDKYIGSSSYKKNILTMVGGRIIAQSIPILLTPLLTRIFSPENFGVFAVYVTITSFIAMISNGRYCLAILLPKEKENAQKLILVSTILTIITTTIFSLLLFFYGASLFKFLNVKELSGHIPFIILNILFIGLYEPLFYYGLREKKYKILASNAIMQAILMIIIRLLLGYLGYTETGLMVSYLFGYSFSYILLFLRLEIPLIKVKAKNFDLRTLLRKYLNFPKFSLFADSLSVLSNTAPNLLMNKGFGSTATGYFSISEKVLGTPIWFVTSSVGDVFKQEASEQYRLTGSCKRIFEKTTKTLFLVGLIPFTLIFFVVPPLVPFLFGDIWAPAGEYIRIFSIMYFSSFVVGPTAYITYIVNKQNYAVAFQGIKLMSIILAFVLGFYYKDLTLYLILSSGLITLSNILMYVFSYKLAKDSKYIEPTKENN